jgi:5'-3' exonuclease
VDFLVENINVLQTSIQFVLDKPIFPFEQLLSVLPAASSSLLPTPYQPLLEEPS